MLDNCIGIFFGKMAPVTANMDVISFWVSAMDIDILQASGHFPEDKIEEQIKISLSHACSYLFKSDDEWVDKYAAANTFDISCGGGGSRSLMYLVVEYSRQLGFHQTIHYKVMTWWIETMVQCWE